MSKLMMLSLWQPWASLCVWQNPIDGKAEKQIETRHWFTRYRGLLAIHATKSLTAEAKFEIQTNKEIQESLLRHGYIPNIHGAKHLTFGAIVGVVELNHIRRFDSSAPHWVQQEFPIREKHFGLYERGRYGWILTNPVSFAEPIYCRGLQALGEPSSEIQDQIFERLGESSKSISEKYHSPLFTTIL